MVTVMLRESASLSPRVVPDAPKLLELRIRGNGSAGKTRTYNPPVNSRMLCH